MPALVDRKHGCFDQVVASGGNYQYSMDVVESQVGRQFDLYSTFWSISTDYPTNPTPPSTRNQHSDVATALQKGRDLLIAYNPAVGYFNSGVVLSTGIPVYWPKWGTFTELLAGVYDSIISAQFTWMFAQAKLGATQAVSAATSSSGTTLTFATQPVFRVGDVIKNSSNVTVGTASAVGALTVTISAAAVAVASGDTLHAARSVVVRPFWEGNLPSLNTIGGTWYPDNSTSQHLACSPTYVPKSTANDNGKKSGPVAIWTTTSDPICTNVAQYKAAFEYFVDLLRSLPNSDVFQSFYCPGANDPSAQVALGAGGVTLMNMYPDPARVDIHGYDNYNTLSSTLYFTPTDTLRGYRESDSTNRYAYDLLQTKSTTKEVWLGEINCADIGGSSSIPGAANVPNGHSKQQWYLDLFALDATVLPKITTLAWFNETGTQTTWKFDSSTSALAGFQQGFNFGSDGTQHGVVAGGVDPDITVPVDPSPEVPFPFRQNYVTGESGRSSWINKVGFVFNSVLSVFNGYVSAKFTAAGPTGYKSGSALTLESGMGTDAYANFTPILKFTPPADSGSDVKYLMASKASTDTATPWQMDRYGKTQYGSATRAGTDPADVITGRTGIGVFSVLGAGNANTATLAAGYTQAKVKVVDEAIVASPGTGTAVLQGNSSAVFVRDQGGSFSLRQEQHAVTFSTQVMPYDPAILSTSGTTGTLLTAGTITVVRLRVFSARTLTRLAGYVQVAGTHLNTVGTVLGIYDSSGTLIDYTADQSTSWTSVGMKNQTVTNGAALVPGTYYVVALGNNTSVSQVTSASTALSGTTLTFGVTPVFAVGEVILNASNATIGTVTVVGSTTVTISAAAVAVASGDTLHTNGTQPRFCGLTNSFGNYSGTARFGTLGTVTQKVNTATSTSSNSLTFDTSGANLYTGGWAVGDTVLNASNATIGTIASIASGSVTLSGNAAVAVASGDSIKVTSHSALPPSFATSLIGASGNATHLSLT